jgi:benzoyl-CoA 2,3-dioxygenase component B
MAINYSEKIPNNVNLTDDRTLQRALEHWQPKFLQWWQTMGPSDFAAADIYLRTAVGVDAAGWASYGQVRMPDYRWGIFLADADPARTIGFGDHMGEPAWQQVPGEYRFAAAADRLGGDTERESRSSSSARSGTAVRRWRLAQPVQINVEEGRHLGRWSTCCAHISGAMDARKPRSCSSGIGRRRQARIPGTFNEPVTDWLSFSCSPISPTATANTSSKPRRIGVDGCADDPVHADGRGAPHVRRRDRAFAGHQARAGGDDRARHRRSDGSA